MRCRDDQHLPDSRQHQRAERVVDHWFVVNGQQLLAYGLGDRVQTSAAASGENDAPSVVFFRNHLIGDDSQSQCFLRLAEEPL